MTLNVDTDLNGASPQFTLTCISTGGPATTVAWTRDSATAMGDAVTVFNDVATAEYTHTLTVTGRQGGDYQCNVSNTKPSEAVANFTVQGTMYMYMLGVLCCFALFVCLTLLASFFLPSHLSFKNMYIYSMCTCTVCV